MKRVLLLAAAVAMLASSSRNDAYVISLGGYSTISGANVDQIVSVTKRIHGRYVWVIRGGREYLITDGTTLSRAQGLFADTMALAPEREAVRREESRLDREIDRLEDKDEALTAAERKRLSELREQQRVVERREEQLDEKRDAAEREAERALWSLVDDAIRTGMAKPLPR